MVTVADSMGPEAFQAAWREAAQAKAGAST